MSIKILSTQKDESAARGERKCKGTAEAGLRADVITKFREYNQLMLKELNVGWHDINLSAHQYDFNFEVKKNEITGGDFTSVSWKSFQSQIDFTPVELFGEIDKNISRIPFAKINQEVQKWLEAESRTVKAAYNFIDAKEKLPLRDCSKVMDMKANPPELNIFCFFNNSGGELVTVSSIPKPEVAMLRAMLDSPLFALVGGGAAGMGLPMKMEKLKEGELQNYLKSDLPIEFSEKTSDLY